MLVVRPAALDLPAVRVLRPVQERRVGHRDALDRVLADAPQELARDLGGRELGRQLAVEAALLLAARLIVVERDRAIEPVIGQRLAGCRDRLGDRAPSALRAARDARVPPMSADRAGELDQRVLGDPVRRLGELRRVGLAQQGAAPLASRGGDVAAVTDSKASRSHDRGSLPRESANRAQFAQCGPMVSRALAALAGSAAERCS